MGTRTRVNTRRRERGRRLVKTRVSFRPILALLPSPPWGPIDQQQAEQLSSFVIMKYVLVSGGGWPYGRDDCHELTRLQVSSVALERA